MITMPNLGPSSSGPAPQGVSLSDATAPALALTRVAQAGSRSAAMLARHAEDIQDVENSSDLTEFALEVKKSHAARMRSFAENHDYRSYEAQSNKDFQGLEKSLADRPMSDYAREKAQNFLTTFKGNAAISVAEAIQQKAIQRNKQTMANGYEVARQSIDPTNPGTGSIEGLLSLQTHMLPEEKEAWRMRYADDTKYQTFDYAVEDDPKGELPDIKAGTGIWKDATVHDQRRYGKMAKINAKKLTGDAIELIGTKIEVGEVETELDLVRLLEGHPDIDEDTAKMMLNRFRADQPATSEQKASWRLRFDQLERDLNSGSIDEVEHTNRYEDLRGEVYSVRNTDVDIGAFKNNLRGVSPYVKDGDSDSLLPEKRVVGNDFLATGKRELLLMLENGIYGMYYPDPKDTKSTGMGWMAGGKHLDNRLAANTKAKRVWDSTRRDFIGWLERNKANMTEEKYSAKINEIREKFIIETE